MKPLRPATPKSIPFAQLAKLGASLEEIAEDGKVEFEAILDLAAELGVGAEKLFAALPNTELEMKTTENIRFEVCAGGCQEWGALPVLERLIDARDQRGEDDETLFDIVPRACLDKCQSAAAVMIDTADGRAMIAAATVEKIDDALDSI